MKLYKYFFASLSIVCLLSSCSQNEKPQIRGMQAVPVTVTNVISTDVQYYDKYPGTVNALNEINLTAQVNGYVTKINFHDGQEVKKGQLLYSIDDQIYQANYQQAMADLQVQEANLVKAQKDADRYHELDKNDAIAKQQVDYADATLEATKKQVAAAKARVESVHSSVKFANIYAPFTGTIGISQVKLGTTVVSGQTILNTISTDSPIAVDFTIDQKEIFHFEKLKEDKKIIQDSIFTIAFGENIFPESGYISVIDRAVDPQTGTIKVRLIFANDKNMLKPGMNTTVRVKNDEEAKQLLIPYKAVTESLGEFTVYVVEDGSKVRQQIVKLGRQIDENVIVKSGLEVGQSIAVEGTQNLHEGSTIKIIQ